MPTVYGRVTQPAKQPKVKMPKEQKQTPEMKTETVQPL